MKINNFSNDEIYHIINMILRNACEGWSLSSKTKYIDDNVVVLEWIFLTKVTIVFGVPEATCAHVETTITFLENDHIGSKLQIFIDFL